MAEEFDIGTLSPADKKEIKAFQTIRDTLFPDGNIPTRDEVEAKINSGKFTVRDAYLAKMYTQGMDTAPLVKEFPDTKEFAKKFEQSFTLKRLEAAAQPKGFADNLSKAINQVSLDDPYDEVSQILKDRGPLNSAIDKVKKGKFPTGIKGSQKLGKELGKYSPQLIQAIGKGISEIPDDNIRAAVVAQLFGSRQVDIFEMRTTKELAGRGVQKRPYFDPETGEQVNPERGSRKQAGPTKVMPPVTAELMRKMHSKAGITGEMFPNLTNNKIDNALKQYVFKAIPKNVLDRLDKAPSTFTDLRRITAAFVLNQLGDPQSASEIISHKGNLDDKIDKVMLKFYADQDDKNILKRTQGLVLFEKELAKGLGVRSAKQLGVKLKLGLPKEFNATYPEVDLKFDDKGKVIVDTKPATKEQIIRGEKIEAAQDYESEQDAFLRGEQKKEKGITLAEKNLERQKKLQAEKELFAETKKPEVKKDGFQTYIDENPDDIEKIKQRKKSKFGMTSTNKKLLGLSGPLAYMGYRGYKSELIDQGYSEKEAQLTASLFTAADFVPYISGAKMILESSTVAASERDPFSPFTTMEEEGQRVIDVSKERDFRQDISPQLDDEQEVGKEMMLKYKRETALQDMRAKTKSKLDEQLQQLNLGRQ